MKKRVENRVLFLTLAAGMLAALTSAGAQNVATNRNDFSPEELTLFNQGAVMETYEPENASGHHITSIQPLDSSHKPKGPKSTILALNFGSEDAKAARDEGISMAKFHYTPAQAHDFIFAEGWSKYQPDRFFTRAYVQEAEAAFVKASGREKD
jgi:hypothetical protein